MSRRRRKKRRIFLAVLTVIALIVLILILLGIASAAFSRRSSSLYSQLMGKDGKSSSSADQGVPDDEHGYYYESFDREGRVIYDTIYNGITGQMDEIEVPTADMDVIEEVWSGVLADHPEFFWLTGATKIITHDPFFGDPYAQVQPARSCDAGEKDIRSGEIETAVSEYLKTVEGDADDYQKIRKAYEYIIDTVDYDVNAPDNQNIYSVFAGRRSVCAGYAKAFQYLMKRQGIPCIYVTGRIRESGENHGWNIVRCHDRWYQVDVTWGDPVYNELSDELPDGLRAMNYDYLCCTDDEIGRTHVADRRPPMPACRYDDLNYYKLNGMYYDTYDTDMFRQIIYDEVDRKEKRTVFCFATPELYEAAREELTGALVREGANRILANSGLTKVRTYYEEEPSMNKIVIYWRYE